MEWAAVVACGDFRFRCPGLRERLLAGARHVGGDVRLDGVRARDARLDDLDRRDVAGLEERAEVGDGETGEVSGSAHDCSSSMPIGSVRYASPGSTEEASTSCSRSRRWSNPRASG